MDFIAGYKIEEILYDSNSSTIYRCSGADGAVVVKRHKKNETDISHSILRAYKLIPDQSIYVPRLIEHTYNEENCCSIYEYINATTLSDVVQIICPSLIEKISLAISVGNAIANLHDLGIIHCNLTPLNILFDGMERCILIDLEASIEVGTNEIPLAEKLSTDWSSPEVISHIKDIDRKADIYGFGLVLYYIFTGEKAFNYTDCIDTEFAHKTRKPKSPTNLSGNIPQSISNIIMRCLEKDKSKRPSIDEIAKAMRVLKQDLDPGSSIGMDTPYDDFHINEIVLPLKYRSDEYAALRNAYTINESGLSFVNIDGPVGIGKSQLIDELVHENNATLIRVDCKKIESDNQLDYLIDNLYKYFDSMHVAVMHIASIEYASTDLLTYIVRAAETKIANKLVIILTFDSKSAPVNSQFGKTLSHLNRLKVPLTEIFLSPVSTDVITSMLNDLFSPSEQPYKLLATLIFEKTNGIPSYISEYIKYLVESKSIANIGGVWTWSINNMRKDAVMESPSYVFDSIKEYIHEDKILVLDILCCSALPLTIQDICTLSGLKESDVELIAIFLTNHNLIVDMENGDSTSLSVHEELCSYRLDEDIAIRGNVHNYVIDLILSKPQILKNRSMLSALTGQLMLNIEKDFVTEISFIRSVAVSAHFVNHNIINKDSFNHLESSYSILCDNPNLWEQDYSTCFYVASFYLRAFESSGDKDKFSQIANGIKEYAENLSDKTSVIEIEIDKYKSSDEHEKAINTSRAWLTELNQSMPKRFPLLYLCYYFFLSTFYLATNYRDRYSMPKATDDVTLSTQRIGYRVGPSLYMADPEMLPVMALKGLYQSLRKGFTAETMQNIVLYGLIVSIGTKYHKISSYFYRYATKIMPSFKGNRFIATTIEFYYLAMIRPWGHSLKECESGLRNLMYKCFASNDLETAAFCNGAYFSTAIMRGANLHDLEDELKSTFTRIQSIGLSAQTHIHRVLWQTVSNLTTETENPLALKGRRYDEEKYESFHDSVSDKTVTFSYRYMKCFLAIVFNDHKEALKYSKLSQKIIMGAFGLPYIALSHLHGIIARVACLRERSYLKRLMFYPILNTFHILNLWMLTRGNKEFEHIQLLGQAEISTLLPSKRKKAEALFRKAKNIASRNGYVNDVAIINERHLRYLEWCDGWNHSLLEMVNETINLYELAGFGAKAISLRSEFNQVLGKRKERSNIIPNEYMELINVLERFTGELNENRIVSNLLLEISKYSGSENCYLLLKDDSGAFKLRAKRNLSNSTESMNLDINECSGFSTHVVHYVINSLEVVLCENAQEDIRFVSDPYISEGQIKSILCLPIISAGEIIGVVYLENNLFNGAFNLERSRLSTVIASLASTTLVNAQINERMKNSDSDKEAYANFVANIAHELRTPLNTVFQAFCLLCENYEIDPTDPNYKGLAQALNQALDLTKYTIEYEKLRNGSFQLSPAPFRLSDTIRNAYNIHAHEAERKGIKLRYPDLYKLHDCYLGDSVRIIQIFNNLLGNGVKFTESGYVSCQINLIESNNTRDLIQFTFQNTGKAISKDFVQHMYKPFMQNDATTTRKHGGFGLGLPITKNIVELMGGTIRYDDTSKDITVFVVQLPLVRSNEAINMQSVRAACIGKDFLDGVKIALVDDNDDDRRLLGIHLNSFGADVKEYGDALVGMEELLKDTTFDIVITDIEMPNMDGYALTSKLRESGLKLPIIGLSAHDISWVGDNCEKAGMTEYTTKPYKKEDIACLIAKCLNIDIVYEEVISVSPIYLPVASQVSAINITHSLLTLSFCEWDIIEFMRSFKDRYYLKVDELVVAIRGEEYKKARALAHSIKGVSLKLSAFVLIDILLRIDQHPEYTTEDDILVLIDASRNVYNDVVIELDYLEEINYSKEQPSDVKLFIAELKLLIENEDAKRKVYAKNINRILSPISKEDSLILSEQLDDDLDEALITLKQIENIYDLKGADNG